jgi:2,3-bisphosphoglycerate-independent phosphoglycerate mutase
MTKPLLLCILDGFGLSKSHDNNAIALADTPFLDHLNKNYLNSALETSGLSVGLPKGQMGNSEVGHMTIGGGRIIMQDLPRISNAITDKSFAKNSQLTDFINELQEKNGACHLLGLLSDGGVHSHIEHIFAFIEILAQHNIKTYIHVFLDGRDTAPRSGFKYLEQLEQFIKPHHNIQIATIMGRYYAMDRDNRWDRVQLAYDAIIDAKGLITDNFAERLKDNYAKDVTDEFIMPLINKDYQGYIENDGIIMANFRSDRVREILSSILDKDFDGFSRAKIFDNINALGVTEYSESLNKLMKVMFGAQQVNNNLGEVLAANQLKQLRIAETEKYAHVTFFFNGGKEDLLQGEDRILIPSLKIATYDLSPAMSANDVTDKIIEVANDYDVIVVNYANCDMVGHSGKLDAAIKAVETIDNCLVKLVSKILDADGTIIITADHGNAENMQDSDGQPNTAHTTNPVPCIVVSNQITKNNYHLADGNLSDIAPTILDILKINIPSEMTGVTLLSKK